MASILYYENLPEIAAIASGTVPLTGYTSGSVVVVNRLVTGGENAIGCAEAMFYANITTGSAGATSLKIYYEESWNGTTWSAKGLAGSISVATSVTGNTITLPVELRAPYTRFFMQSPAYTLVASAIVRPAYYEGQ